MLLQQLAQHRNNKLNTARDVSHESNATVDVQVKCNSRRASQMQQLTCKSNATVDVQVKCNS